MLAGRYARMRPSLPYDVTASDDVAPLETRCLPVCCPTWKGIRVSREVSRRSSRESRGIPRGSVRDGHGPRMVLCEFPGSGAPATHYHEGNPGSG